MQRGWVYEPVISNYEALMLYNALKRHPDTFYYRPVAIAKREQSGMKYRYLCIATPKDTPGSPSHFADIEVYKPLMGMPYATCISKLEFDNLITQKIPL